MRAAAKKVPQQVPLFENNADQSKVVSAVMQRTRQLIMPRNGRRRQVGKPKPHIESAKPLLKKWQVQSNAFQAALKAMRAFKVAMKRATALLPDGQTVMQLPVLLQFPALLPPPPPCAHCISCTCGVAMR